jgi:hypothetical protein
LLSPIVELGPSERRLLESRMNPERRRIEKGAIVPYPPKPRAERREDSLCLQR